MGEGYGREYFHFTTGEISVGGGGKSYWLDPKSHILLRAEEQPGLQESALFIILNPYFF